MHYVSHNGYVWRLTARQYALLRQLIGIGQEYDLDHIGKCLGHLESIADIEHSLTSKV